jgi:hypothetical protein
VTATNILIMVGLIMACVAIVVTVYVIRDDHKYTHRRKDRELVKSWKDRQ